MGFRQLRQSLPIEEFDYQLLINHLSEYSNKRDVITRMIRNEQIIRVKKGLYVFGPDYRKGLIIKESLANLIYGPSYISFEYALSFYGMIPERVETLTSATTGRTRKFTTPLGVFSYQHLPTDKYSVGITLKKIDDYHSIFIASPEKALLDQVYYSRGLSGKILLEEYFFEDLRIDENSLKALSPHILDEIANGYASPKIQRAVNFLKSMGKHG